VDAEKVFEYNLYNPKFNYHELSRQSVDGKRMYQTPDGKKVPSVTTVLEKTKPEEKKQALQQWRNRVGHAQAQAITTEAANRGTRMHTYLEHYVKTGELKEAGTNPYAWPSHAMATTVIDQGLKHVNEFWGVEIPLYFPNLYAGTSDGAGIHLGNESILDYKQTNRPKKREWIEDYFLQLVAYALAHNEIYGTKIRKGVVLMCVKPEIDDNFNIIKPPEYQEFVLEECDFDHWEQQWWKRLELYYLQA
jgi:genome maintenance exonuclease 1